MCLRLRLNSTSTIPISVAGILPHVVCTLPNLEIAKTLIWHGNQQVELGELFEVAKTKGNDQRIEFEGDLSSVHWLGRHLDGGTIVVEGNIGRHVGSQMSGGKILINGNAGDYLGCEITGGTIVVANSSGDWTGAGYPGTKAGMNGGFIAIKKHAGHGTGSALRRGTICVGENVGRLTGWNMKAGTIAIGGQSAEMTGLGMVRGTILLPAPNHSEANIENLPVTFTQGSKSHPAVLNTTLNWIRKSVAHIPVADSGFRQFHGDHLKGGRGEVFVGCPASH